MNIAASMYVLHIMVGGAKNLVVEIKLKII